MSKPMMFILILAVVAILAFVGVYAYRSSNVRFQGAQQNESEKQEIEDELFEDEETNDEEIEEETEGNTEEVEDQEDATLPVDTIIEEDLTPSL